MGGIETADAPVEKKVVTRVWNFLKRKGISDIVLDLFAELCRRSAFQHWKELVDLPPLNHDIEEEEVEDYALTDDKSDNLQSCSSSSFRKTFSISSHNSGMVFSRLVLMAAASAS